MNKNNKINSYCKYLSYLEEFTTKVFNILFVVISFILILMSIIALTAIHLSLLEKPFSFTTDGLNFYLETIGQYSSLFAGTITVITVYLGLMRLKAAIEANNDKRKQDYFSEWKYILEIRSTEVKDEDPRMVREFYKLRYELYVVLYSYHFKINNKDELQLIFDNVYNKEIIKFFEEMNQTALGTGHIYPSKVYSYSFNSFIFLFLGCLNEYYKGMEDDLKELYLENIDPKRKIDYQLYQVALSNYYKKKN